jgi:polyhydroxybutyrate depolymerase
MFHGFPGSGSEFETITGMDQNSDQEGFIVVYPDGFGTGRLRTWNAGDCCGPAMESNIDDVGFVSSLIDYLETKANIDPRRVYAAGMSNGAMLCHRLGCELSGRIAAIGAVSGTIMTDSCDPSRPVPVIMIHGTLDPAVPFDGGQGSGVPGLVFKSVPQTVDIWKNANGCTGDTRTPYMEMPRMLAKYQGDCPGGADIVLCTIEGGTHLWPGPISFIERFLHEGPQPNPPDQPIFSANEILWRFFQEHPM